MPENDPLADRQQPDVIRIIGRCRLDAQSLRRAPQQHWVARRLSRRQQQKTSCVLGKGLQTTDEALLDPPGERLRSHPPKAERQLGCRQPARQLLQRQRIPVRLGDDPLADGRIQERMHRRSEQRAGIAVAQAPHLQPRDVLQLSTGLARCENDPERLGQQTTSHKRQGHRRRPIKPLRVIDDAYQRTLFRHL